MVVSASEFAVRSAYTIASDREEARHCKIRTRIHLSTRGTAKKTVTRGAVHSSLLVWLLVCRRCAALRYSALRCALLVHAPLFFSLGQVTRRRFTLLENNTPARDRRRERENEREREREREQAAREQDWCCLCTARNVRGHSSMTARLTYAVNYANSYGMRSFVRVQQQKQQRGKKRKERERDV